MSFQFLEGHAIILPAAAERDWLSTANQSAPFILLVGQCQVIQTAQDVSLVIQ